MPERAEVDTAACNLPLQKKSIRKRVKIAAWERVQAGDCKLRGSGERGSLWPGPWHAICKLCGTLVTACVGVAALTRLD